MPRYRLSIPAPPRGASWVADFQESGVNLGTANWSPLLDNVTVSPVEFDLVHSRDVLVRIRVRDPLGFVGTKVRYRTIRVDVPQAAAVAAPATIEATQDGPTLLVDVPTEPGYEAEVRVSDAVVAQPYDALPAGRTGGDAGCCAVAAPVPPDAAAANVHARLVRTADGKRGPWLTVEAPVMESAEWGSVADHADTFGGTIGQQGGKDTLEVTSAGLVPKRLPKAYNTANDAKAYNGTTNVRLAYVPHPFPSRCVYEADEVVMDAPVDFRLQAFPATTIDRASMKAYSPANLFPTRLPRSVERVLSDPEAYYRAMSCRARETKAYADSSGSPDRAPPDVTQEVSLSQDGSTWGDYRAIRPDEDLVAMGIRARLVVVPPLAGGGIAIPRWDVRRRRRNRKWEFQIPIDVANGTKTYTFPEPLAVLDQTTLRAVATAEATANAKVTFHVYVASISRTQITIQVMQFVRDSVVTDSGGDATWTYPKSFGAAPLIIVSPVDSSEDSFAGFHSQSATQASIYANLSDGTAAATKTVHCHASGPPASNGGVLVNAVIAGY